MNSPFAGPILCPVDFSDLSRDALDLAVRIGERCAQPVTALYAQWFEVPSYLTEGPADRITAELRESLQQARSGIQRFVHQTTGGAAQVRVEEGDVREVILRAAQDSRAGLIVMGTRGRSGMRRMMRGSVAAEVLRASDVPVLTVRSSAPDLSSIVCAVNDSDLSRRALLYAALLARCLDAQLTVLHVVERDPGRAIPDLCSWVGHAKPPDCRIEQVTRIGDAAREIVRFIEARGAKLLVPGVEHKLFLDKTTIGATVAQLMRHGPCAMLAIPGGAISNALSDQIDKTA